MLRSTARVLRTLAVASLCVVCAGLTAPATADVITGEPRVIDGDTIDVAGERVRLHGIDAPETRQNCDVAGTGWACGKNASAFLAGATAGRMITCKGDKRDRYGRLIAVCYLGDQDLNARMVRDGWALAYRRYANDYVTQESEARAAGSGIWRSQFVEPWEWRKQARAAH
jgi:endonuclease YncB( thermonuclease family)